MMEASIQVSILQNHKTPKEAAGAAEGHIAAVKKIAGRLRLKKTARTSYSYSLCNERIIAASPANLKATLRTGPASAPYHLSLSIQWSELTGKEAHSLFVVLDKAGYETYINTYTA